jgi:Flp pilus assembly protein TadG
MRRLMPTNDRGVSSIIIALLMTCLIASVGLGVDSSSLAYQRGRVQHSADNAARAIAQDCVLKKVACSTSGATSTASYFAAQNSSGGTASIPGGVSTTSTSVTVKVDKVVPTRFFGVLGVNSKTVSARAKASWTGHPTEGTTMLPMGIPWCMYKNNLPPSTTPILLRSDVISVVFNVIVQGGTLGRVITTVLGDLLNVTTSCTSPDGLNLKMLRGPIWLSGLDGAVNGVLNWNSSVCNMHLGTITGFLGSSISSVIPSNCVNKFGSSIRKGQIITMPIYVPSISLEQLGLETDACLLGICSATVPPRIGVKVVGFAPFKVTGWNYPNNVNLDPNAPACSSINLQVQPPASVGCNGIQGYFVKSMQADPNFTYDPNAMDLGGTDVRLSE